MDINQNYEGCSHYKRKCKLVAPCCGGVYSCRFCHDDSVSGHTIDRRLVTEVECGVCGLRQAVTRECVGDGCDTVFGSAHFCAVCKLYDDTNKGQFHCEGCGICRVGGRDQYTHCFTCGLCLPRDKAHKCIQDTSHNNCPVCMEDIHNSRDGAHIPPCSHLLHYKCYSEMLDQGLYACPTCGLAMVDMSSAWRRVDREVQSTPMPREYADLHRVILCRDCNKKTTAVFHIVGMKCGQEGCGSYNTAMDAGPLLRKTGENTFVPLSDQELARLSNVEMPESIEIDQSDNNDHDDRSDSDSDGGWETTEEVDDDGDVNGQANDG